MLRALWLAVLSAASMACGFAALGVALYAHGPTVAAAALFGSVGALAGGLCAALHLAFGSRPAPHGAALPAPALARLVRATLARAASDRQDRPGIAADRRPAPPAGAAAGAAGAATSAATSVAAATATAAVAAAALAATPAAAPPATRQPVPAGERRFASSAFGA